MTYSEWKNKFVNDALSDATKTEYVKFSNKLGKNAPSLEDFAKIRYNDAEWKAFKSYTSSIKSGELTPLVDFDLYKKISKQIDTDIVGTMTSNGIKVTGKSNHFIARVFGSIEQRRSGVSVSNVLDTLQKPISIDDIKDLKDRRSQRFISDKAIVTINPDTGVLIQTNPRPRKKVNQ